MILRGNVAVTTAVLHCAAVASDWHKGKTAQDVRRQVDEWHRQRGWSGIGYHYVVTPRGEIAKGRALYEAGAHVAGHNAQTLGILLVESRRVEKTGDYYDYFTDEQRQAVRAILAIHEIRDVKGHNDYTEAKLCPGFKVRPELFIF